MFWNHRVIEAVGEDGEKYYGIHEVYYDNDGNPRAYTENPVGVSWGQDDNPMQVLEWMTNCLSKPYLKKSDFPDPIPLDWDEAGVEEMADIEEFLKGLRQGGDEPR